MIEEDSPAEDELAFKTSEKDSRVGPEESSSMKQPTIGDIRRELCDCIGGMDSDATLSMVESNFLPILDKLSPERRTGDGREEEEVDAEALTPLLLACDKGQLETCFWLLQAHQKSSSARMTNLLGSILRPRAPQSGNTAVHQAAMTGNVGLFQLLLRFASYQNGICESDWPALGSKSDDDEGDETNEPKKSSTNSDEKDIPAMIAYSFAALKNNHDDTPIMMAVVNDSLELIQYWCSLLRGSSNTSASVGGIVQLLQTRNHDAHSALSMACGYGRVDMMRIFLCQEWKLSLPTPEDYDLAQASLKHTREVLARAAQRRPIHDSFLKGKDKGKQEQFSNFMKQEEELRHRCESIQVCVKLLEQALHEKSLSVSEELLRMEEAEKSSSSSTKKKKNRNKAKRGIDKRVAKHQQQQQQNTGLAPQEREDDMKFVSLANGKTGFAVQGRAPDERVEDGRQHQQNTTTTKSVDELFRAAAVTTATTTSKNSNYPKEEYTDILQALCLNPSQLLLPAQNMALNLSPSQLDAVDQILERQRRAVQEARGIQARLHATAKDGIGKPTEEE